MPTEPVWLSEIGLNRATPTSDVNLVAFSTAYSAYRVTDNVFNAVQNAYVQTSAYGDTLTTGLELEGLWAALREP